MRGISLFPSYIVSVIASPMESPISSQIMVAVISFTNLINTMLTSIVTRKRELGILQAIGLSDRQAVSVFGESGIDWAMFHSFRQDADGITLFPSRP